MLRVKYTNWWDSRKVEQSIESALAKMDLFNKTLYGRRKVIDEKLLLEAAKSSHENGKVYYVTIYEDENPYCYFENNKAFFRVSFLDEHLRKYMSYDFTNESEVSMPKKLFLSVVKIWDFKGDSDKVVKITSYIFHTDGKFVIVERDHIKNEQTNSEAKNKIDVSANWEDYPGFGKYDSIIRIERGLNMVLETNA
ncbi:hypothetical protein SAMN06298216_0910 [Spirosomataceae bacterium TFI 002]|nr:hypothetical protein SAMN06298216_0910 [Spirosomataceae bacterium TFI 002]